MNNVILTFKGQKVAVKLADTPKVFTSIKALESVFGKDKLTDNDYQDDDMGRALKTLYSAVATFWAICPDDIAKIFYGKSLLPDTKHEDLDKTSQEILNLVTGENAFKKGTKERDIAKELFTQFKIYKKAMSDYLSFDTDGFPLFTERQEEIKQDVGLAAGTTPKEKELLPKS